jgi:hypothetical protein
MGYYMNQRFVDKDGTKKNRKIWCKDMAHWKRASFHLFINDILAVAGCCRQTLSNYCKKKGFVPSQMNLEQIYEFIKEMRNE